LLIARSACAAPAASVSVALLLPGTGSVTPTGGVTVAVLLNAPVVAAGTVPLTVNVAVVPTGSVTSASMLPLPAAVSHAAPAHHFGDKRGLLTAIANAAQTENLVFLSTQLRPIQETRCTLVPDTSSSLTTIP